MVGILQGSYRVLIESLSGSYTVLILLLHIYFGVTIGFL